MDKKQRFSLGFLVITATLSIINLMLFLASKNDTALFLGIITIALMFYHAYQFCKE
jgi:lipopolysaccharide export LptBFGC system permease protein LptF